MALKWGLQSQQSSNLVVAFEALEDDWASKTTLVTCYGR